jgi:hypothetical protein
MSQLTDFSHDSATDEIAMFHDLKQSIAARKKC